MRNFIFSLAVIAAIFPAASQAAIPADNYLVFAPYIGGDYEFSHYTQAPTGVENNYNGGDVHVGLRFQKYLGVEASYFATETGVNQDLGAAVKSRFEGANIDMMLYAPLTSQFELVGSAGANYTKGYVKIAGFGKADGEDWDARYGLGAQYWLTSNVNVRAMMHYTHDNNDGSDVFAPSVGLNLQY